MSYEDQAIDILKAASEYTPYHWTDLMEAWASLRSFDAVLDAVHIAQMVGTGLGPDSGGHEPRRTDANGTQAMKKRRQELAESMLVLGRELRRLRASIVLAINESWIGRLWRWVLDWIRRA